MRRPGRLALILIAVFGAALLAWAWVKGGREPLREIAQPIAVPEGAR